MQDFAYCTASEVGLCYATEHARVVDCSAGNLKKHIACLQKLTEKPCEGEASLQNALELTSQSLRSINTFTVFILSALRLCLTLTL